MPILSSGQSSFDSFLLHSVIAGLDTVRMCSGHPQCACADDFVRELPYGPKYAEETIPAVNGHLNGIGATGAQ